jgi:hypothetical protein
MLWDFGLAEKDSPSIKTINDAIAQTSIHETSGRTREAHSAEAMHA